jgi:hypothetical protein
LFKTPKDILYDLLCKDGDLDPKDFLGEIIVEHGYSWGIVHENYPDANTDDFADIAECMSIADVKDVEIYNGYSQMAMFSLVGIVIPAISINHSLIREKMRPGSSWTKFNNYKMRQRQYQSMSNRINQSKIDIDSLMVISTYCKHDQERAIEIMKSYGFQSSDMDVMNHICLTNKIKPRVLQNIKKLLGKE